jgi:hypothetical protein
MLLVRLAVEAFQVAVVAGALAVMIFTPAQYVFALAVQAFASAMLPDPFAMPATVSKCRCDPTIETSCAIHLPLGSFQEAARDYSYSD